MADNPLRANAITGVIHGLVGEIQDIASHYTSNGGWQPACANDPDAVLSEGWALIHRINRALQLAHEEIGGILENPEQFEKGQDT